MTHNATWLGRAKCPVLWCNRNITNHYILKSWTSLRKAITKKSFVNDVDPYERVACERMPVFEEDDFSRYLVDIVKKRRKRMEEETNIPAVTLI